MEYIHTLSGQFYMETTAENVPENDPYAYNMQSNIEVLQSFPSTTSCCMGVICTTRKND